MTERMAGACALTLTILTVWAAPSTAGADVLDVTGDVLDARPVGLDLYVGSQPNTTGLAFVERRAIEVPTGFVFVDELSAPGRIGAGEASPPPVVTVTTTGRVKTHLIHFEGPTGSDARFVGSVTFDAEIVGVQFRSSTLTDSDLVLGSDVLNYPMGDRGVEVGDVTSGDRIELVDNLLTINFELSTTVDQPIDEIRVITRNVSPDASVQLDCEVDLVVGVDLTTLDALVTNTGSEDSLPVVLAITRTPAGTPVTAEPYFDDMPITCVDIGPLSLCPLGSVAPGDTVLRADFFGMDPQRLMIGADLRGRDVMGRRCNISISFTPPVVDDAGVVVDVDGGGTGPPPGTPTPNPSFGGGGGCVCRTSARASSQHVALGWVLLAGLIVVLRRRSNLR